MAWIDILVGSADHRAAERLAQVGFQPEERRRTIKALKEGLEVLKRKQLSQKLLWSGPENAFARIGIRPDPKRTVRRVRLADAEGTASSA